MLNLASGIEYAFETSAPSQFSVLFETQHMDRGDVYKWIGISTPLSNLSSGKPYPLLGFFARLF